MYCKIIIVDTSGSIASILEQTQVCSIKTFDTTTVSLDMNDFNDIEVAIVAPYMSWNEETYLSKLFLLNML